jgi:hypothetical protein
MGRASKRILREDGDREERRERKIKPSRHHNKRGEYEVEIIINRDQGIRTMINAIGNPRTNRSSVLFFLFCWRERSLGCAFWNGAPSDDPSRDPIFCRAIAVFFRFLTWLLSSSETNNSLSLLNGSVASRHFHPWLRSWMSSVFKHARSLSGVSRLRAALLNSQLYKVIFLIWLCPSLDIVLNAHDLS